MNENVQTECELLDFSKAFDRIAHSRLLANITSFNLPSLPTSWLRRFGQVVNNSHVLTIILL